MMLIGVSILPVTGAATIEEEQCCFDVEIPRKINIFITKVNIKEICGIKHNNVNWQYIIYGLPSIPGWLPKPDYMSGTITNIPANGVQPIRILTLVFDFKIRDISIDISIDGCDTKTFNAKLWFCFLTV